MGLCLGRLQCSAQLCAFLLQQSPLRLGLFGLSVVAGLPVGCVATQGLEFGSQVSQLQGMPIQATPRGFPESLLCTGFAGFHREVRRLQPIPGGREGMSAASVEVAAMQNHVVEAPGAVFAEGLKECHLLTRNVQH